MSPRRTVLALQRRAHLSGHALLTELSEWWLAARPNVGQPWRFAMGMAWRGESLRTAFTPVAAAHIGVREVHEEPLWYVIERLPRAERLSMVKHLGHFQSREAAIKAADEYARSKGWLR
jgi:hypothetical protein